MKRKLLFIVFCLILILGSNLSSVSVFAGKEDIYLGGMPAGFSLEMRGAYVAGLTEVITENGLVSPSKEAGIQVGDIIMTIDGKEVNNANDIAISLRDGLKKNLEIKRNKETIYIMLTPARDLTRNYKLGVFIRDNVCGIGTITFYKGNKFASLGHPVIDDKGEILNVVGGNLYKSDISGYKRGERGNPGELHGIIYKNEKLGNISLNNINGVYGEIAENSIDYSKLVKIERGDAQMGKAYIYTTILGGVPRKYEISIVKIDKDEQVKNFVIKINDKKLLKTTGGIVQGMSGSPIIQNDKIVGAVTHVFVNDPSRGFGISIDNMLNNM